jgi:hypothetical protein
VISSLEVINDRQLSQLRRHSRAERRQSCERLLADPLELLQSDLSQLRSRPPLCDREGESALPPPPPRAVRRHENPIAVALILRALDVAAPLLVCFRSSPSRAFEARLRQSAKVRGYHLDFFLVIDCYAALDLQP